MVHVSTHSTDRSSRQIIVKLIFNYLNSTFFMSISYVFLFYSESVTFLPDYSVVQTTRRPKQ